MTSGDSIELSLDSLEEWVEARDYKGYDPGDGLNSVLRPLALNNSLAERILLQVIWKSPVNLRPLVGVKPMDSTKGRGYMASGYLQRYRTTGDSRYLDRAVQCLEWLMANGAQGQAGYSWGNHFDFVTRSGCTPAGSPIIVWTSLIGLAFLEAFETTGQQRFLDVGRSVGAWILRLPREESSSGSCLSYVPFKQSSIHNSNMLGAGMLASLWRHTREDELRSVARSAVEYTCSRQRPDGSWWYGEDPKYHWIDNFHTGYVLDSLKRYLDSTGDETFRPHFQRGLRYFLNTFIRPDGAPAYYHDKTYPIDIQCAAQAIETMAFCAADDAECLALARKVAAWTIMNMQSPDGHFYFRRYPLLTARTAYIHWGQATMYKALAMLLSRAQPGHVG